MTHLFLTTVLLFALVCAAVKDLQSWKIPNWVTFPTILVGLSTHTLVNGYKGFLFSLEGFGLGIGLLAVFYMLGGMGAGDVKLLGAVGSIIGPGDVFWAFLAAATLGGLYTIAVMIVEWGLPSTAERVRAILTTWIVTRRIMESPDRTGTQPQLRYGLVLALGTIGSQSWGMV